MVARGRSWRVLNIFPRMSVELGIALNIVLSVSDLAYFHGCWGGRLFLLFWSVLLPCCLLKRCFSLVGY